MACASLEGNPKFISDTPLRDGRAEPKVCGFFEWICADCATGWGFASQLRRRRGVAVVQPARGPDAGVPSRCLNELKARDGRAGALKSGEPGVLRRRPLAQDMFLRAHVQYTTCYYATVVRSHKCSADFFWICADCATGRDFAPQAATSRGRSFATRTAHPSPTMRRLRK